MDDLRLTTTEVAGPRMDRLKSIAGGMFVVGLLLVGYQAMTAGPLSALTSYLFAYWFWTGVTVGSLGLLLLHHTVGGGWGFIIRRQLEAATRLLPAMAVLFVPIAAAMFSLGLYEWNTPEGLQDHVIQQKAAWLNPTRFLVFAALYYAIWIGYATFLDRLGATQDERADPKIASRLSACSAFGLVLFVITASFASFDWIMSLTPKWLSSIFGLLTVVGFGLSTLAAHVLLFAFLFGQHPLIAKVRTGHFRDLGNLTLAFVMLWGYMAFSQYVITFSGNTAEEVTWFVVRREGGWGVISLGLIVVHFAIPFLWLLTQSPMKRSPVRMAPLAAWIVVMRLLDCFYLVAPTFRSTLSITPADIGAPLLIGGVWVFLWIGQLAGKPVVPLHDPRFQQHQHEGFSNEVAAHG